MRIQKISVTGLFGIFDHEIPLNIDDRITILHSPNGFGKTVILRMINGLFNSRYSVFWTIPLKTFRVTFDNGNTIEVVPGQTKSKNTKSKKDLNLNFYQNNETVLSHSFWFNRLKYKSDINFQIDLLEEIIPEIQRFGFQSWRNLLTGEILSLNEVIDRFEDIILLKLNLEDEPDWLEKQKNNIHIRLIESQRLLNFVPISSSKLDSGSSSMLQTVAAYSEELAQLIQDQLAEYGTTSQSLDRTFPARVLQQQRSSDLTDEQLRHKLNELEKTRSRLIAVGLLDKDENSNFSIQPQSMDDSTKNILSVYVEDIQKKLSVFQKVSPKIELFRKVINNKFFYKKINLDREKGFTFKICNDSENSSLENLSPTDLSSGEQQELILLYELLFKVKPGSLVLIDEPELSLHVGWQVQFLKDLQEIAKLANLDVLMATHSPDIIQDRWDLTVELKSPAK